MIKDLKRFERKLTRSAGFRPAANLLAALAIAQRRHYEEKAAGLQKKIGRTVADLQISAL